MRALEILSSPEGGRAGLFQKSRRLAWSVKQSVSWTKLYDPMERTGARHAVRCVGVNIHKYSPNVMICAAFLVQPAVPQWDVAFSMFHCLDFSSSTERNIEMFISASKTSC